MCECTISGKKNNISNIDQLLTLLDLLRSQLPSASELLSIHRSYENSLNVMLDILKKRYPIAVIFRNTHLKALMNRRAVRLPWFILVEHGHFDGPDYRVICDIERSTAVIMSADNCNKKQVKLINCINNGDLVGIFVKADYKALPVQGRTVIDVGANIGDSSIYFILQGAQKVVALEPYPANYQIASRNVKVNNLEDKIRLLFAGCSGKTQTITLDNHFLKKQENCFYKLHDGTQVLVASEQNKNDAFYKLHDGIQVPLLSLHDVLEANTMTSDDDIILKMDCEGCEYDAILSADRNVLQRFSHILVEYHHGYQNLREKFLLAGFHISISRPIYSMTEDSKKMYRGTIFAKRQ
jgi:FkbM family methyltransferase